MRRRLSLDRHPSTAPQLPGWLQRSEVWNKVSAISSEHLNFYRLHLIIFIIVPFVASGIFYASNGPSPENQILYIDALFMCVSCMTVTGLNSVLLARLTVWQQVILFLLMTIGSTSFVSIIVILVRRQFFRNKFEYMVANDESARRRVNEVGEQEARLHGRAYDAFTATRIPGQSSLARLFLPSDPTTPHPSPSDSRSATAIEEEQERNRKEAFKKKKKKPEKLSAEMIKRVDVPVRINAMSVSGRLGENQSHQHAEGQIHSTGDVKPVKRDAKGVEEAEARGRPDLPAVFTDEEDVGEGPLTESPQPATPEIDGPQPSATGRAIHIAEPPTPHPHIHINEPAPPVRTLRGRRSSDSAAASPHRLGSGTFPRVRTLDPRHLDHITESSPSTPTSAVFHNHDNDRDFARTRTIEFREHDSDLRLRRHRTGPINPDYPIRRMSHSNLRDMNSRTLTRMGTIGPPERAIHSGFGGFPNPLYAAADFAKAKIPALRNAVERSMTMPRTTTIMSTHSQVSGLGAHGDNAEHVKPVSYISFDAVVGRNSRFHHLTTAQQEELGGVEYRALTLLLRIVASYYLFGQLLAVLLLAPWLSHSRTYTPVLDAPDTHVNPTWFVFFQVWSAFSNNGMSLVDASMIPFQKAYFLIIVMCLLILGGNTALPVFLRLTIWTISKLVPRHSRTRETLQFLLDHPRRCYIYLFPSHQTWFLVFALICLNGIDWASFLILDIGNPDIESIPTGTRVLDGLFQGTAVRAAGFSIVPLSTTAPAVQLLYVIMMYIAVYPIAVSIRSTNVYEEKSMGVYDEDFDDPDDVEAKFEKTHSATQYIGYHARKQLAFDMWWLVLAVWLICIVERHRIGSDDWPEVTIFTLIFEVVSAYGTVGLSLGNNRNNTSLSGVLSTLSKLIVLAVMIRGRHRGLPIAIDRAVLLPSDLEKHFDDTSTALSHDSPGADFPLRTRTTRSSLNRGPRGLDAVEPMADGARVERSRQASGMTSPGDESKAGGRGESAINPQEQDPSVSSGKETGSSSAEEKGRSEESVGGGADGGEREEPPHNPDVVGWR
ncbi:hypothetical protein JCM21900_001587 [Sporobolomyces salmonicolor]